MNGKYRFERRTPSVIKPLFYLLLQLTALFELHFLIKVYLEIYKFNFLQSLPFYLLGMYFIIRTFKIIDRQKKSIKS